MEAATAADKVPLLLGLADNMASCGSWWHMQHFFFVHVARRLQKICQGSFTWAIFFYWYNNVKQCFRTTLQILQPQATWELVPEQQHSLAVHNAMFVEVWLVPHTFSLMQSACSRLRSSPNFLWIFSLAYQTGQRHSGKGKKKFFGQDSNVVPPGRRACQAKILQNLFTTHLVHYANRARLLKAAKFLHFFPECNQGEIRVENPGCQCLF